LNIGRHADRSRRPGNHRPEITALDHTLLALADPTRRAILQRLSETPGGTARVTDLAQPFAISLNAVSKPIRLLERNGLVTRRHGGWTLTEVYSPTLSSRRARGVVRHDMRHPVCLQ
jgi:DNA-binding transcriptional ArsR family regulator